MKNFHGSVALLFLFGISQNFHKNVEREIWNNIHHFGKFLLIFELGRDRDSAPNQA